MNVKYSILYASILTVAALSGCGSDEAVDDGVIATMDTTPPAITLMGNESIDVVFNAVFRDLGAEAVDDIDGIVPVVTEGTVDTAMPGTYELSYSATDAAGNESTITRSVIVLEDSLPGAMVSEPVGPLASVFDGVLIGADYWSDEPEILSAGMGFADIVGIDAPAVTFDLARDAGAGWSSDIDCAGDIRNYTATSILDQVAATYILQSPYGELKDASIGLDGLPIVFSWPVDTSTVNLADFQFTLNTGDIVRPLAVGPFPNLENNERNTIVVFADWGNRLPSNDPDSRFPVKLEIVEDDTPLLLVGPGNQAMSAVGLTWETSSTPYNENSGPRLVGAKLNRIDGRMEGESTRSLRQVFLPNDASVLYIEGDFMLRMLTSGGFSPDGVSGVKPNEFERYFRIHAVGEDGSTVIIDRVDQEYVVSGGTLKVVGLSDLGQPEGGDVYFDECYDEDLDNYIDIILVGDEEAARNITFLEIPSLEGGYSPFYSPGGPGRTPFEGVTYTQPGPADLEPVIIALDDPMRVDYDPAANSDEGADNRLTFEFEGITREYLLTVPEAYTGNTAVPLLFDFHQINGTAEAQFADSQFNVIAERDNFILVTPQAIGGVWTVTGFPVSNGANDLGFINALINELSSTYTIDTNRIYASGMSNGSFFSLDLACNFSTTFAAIAPVSGVLTPDLQQNCTPERPMPILQTHGTADDQIPYSTAEATVLWWATFNQTNLQPEITELPDPFPGNGSSVQRYVYLNEGNGVAVEHLRIEGAGHVWPGSDGVSDINMAEEAWAFLSRYDLNGRI